MDVPKNTSIAEGNYRGELVIVLHSLIDSYLKTSLVQVRKHNTLNTSINYTNKHTTKIHNECGYTLIIIKNFLHFFFNVYKNERKEYKF